MMPMAGSWFKAGLIGALALVLWPAVAQAHGGGCRKSSPPGQCCHMDKASGQVHCH